jgi:hypothetical protein
MAQRLDGHTKSNDDIGAMHLGTDVGAHRSRIREMLELSIHSPMGLYRQRLVSAEPCLL